MIIEDDKDEEDVIVDKQATINIIQNFHQKPGRLLLKSFHN